MSATYTFKRGEITDTFTVHDSYVELLEGMSARHREDMIRSAATARSWWVSYERQAKRGGTARFERFRWSRKVVLSAVYDSRTARVVIGSGNGARLEIKYREPRWFPTTNEALAAGAEYLGADSYEVVGAIACR
jgi:hypothetical protein